MTLKKQLMIGAAAGSLCIISLVGIASASANTKPASLAQEIAGKFNLKPADVQAVIDTHKTEKQTYRGQAEADRVAAAVKAGTITQSQANALKAKLAELKTDRPTGGAKPTDAQRAAMKAKMDDFRQWLTNNKIPESLVRPYGNGGREMHENMMGPDQN